MAMEGSLTYNFYGLMEMMSRDGYTVSNGLEVPWERYEEVQKTFRAVKDPMAHLKNLRQDGSIK
ncbi:hypothetical protein Tco_1117865, partial [Tanacetum coccineum]